MHPLGKVLALAHGDTVPIESRVIMLYVADQFPQAKMAPPQSPERGRYYEWFTFLLATVEPAAVIAFQNPLPRAKAYCERHQHAIPTN